MPLRKYLLVIVIIGAVSLQAGATTWYVAAGGSDANSGTADSAFATIPKAVSVSTAGDTIYVRGGHYTLNTSITLSRVGSAASRYHLYAYPGERPLLDFSAMAVSSSNRAIKLSGSYWHIRGFDVYKAGDNGMFISGSYNIVEFCSFSENADTGLQLGNGASNNQIINCDSFYNADPGQGNADGFSPKLDVGSGNYFYGCRSWQNSDDGWDGYLRGTNGVTTTIENCWCFNNGYLKTGLPSSGNGNGFKMGGSDTANLEHYMTLKNCFAFDNRVKGFDQNNNRGSMTLLNCTAYRNGTNYSISGPIDAGMVLTVKNCVALGPYGSLGSFAVQATNSWMSPFVVDQTDFVSIDTTGMRGPRKPDGSLPDVTFMHLARGSDLIDAGTDVGLPFNGAAPDLGCFESNWPDAVNDGGPVPVAFRLEQNYPNPFNPGTLIRYAIPGSMEYGGGNREVRLVVYDVLGREVAVLANDSETPGEHEVFFDGSGLASGVYVYRLEAGSPSTGSGPRAEPSPSSSLRASTPGKVDGSRGFVQSRKMMLMK